MAKSRSGITIARCGGCAMARRGRPASADDGVVGRRRVERLERDAGGARVGGGAGHLDPHRLALGLGNLEQEARDLVVSGVGHVEPPLAGGLIVGAHRTRTYATRVARVLLLLPTATYRAADFLTAARALGAEVVVASERRLVSIGDAQLTLDPPRPGGGGGATAGRWEGT